MTSTEGVPPPAFAHVLNTGERQLLNWIADGDGYKVIARRLNIHEQTVTMRAARMFAKLAARDRANAVHIGHRIGVLT